MEHRPHVTLAGICCSRLDGGKQAFQARTTGTTGLLVGIAFTAFPRLVGVLGWMFYEIYDTVCVRKEGLSTLFKPDFAAYVPKLEEDKIRLRKLRGLAE